MEVVVGMAVASVALVLAAQLATWSLADRARTRDRQIAEELAVNVLEEARGCPWDQLTPSWAASRELPLDLKERGWTLKVDVAVHDDLPMLKKVTVEVRPSSSSGGSMNPVDLTTLLAPREAMK
jgi:hypothetical protein